LVLFIAMATAFALSGNASVESDGPFSSLAGTWYGGGQINLKGGNTERLRCRGYYSLKNGGSSLGMAILCASTGYKIELRSVLHSHSEVITGVSMPPARSPAAQRAATSRSRSAAASPAR
jgi:hypothetical protein